MWVFDGEPPSLKSQELKRRKELKKQALEAKETAINDGDFQKAKQMAGRAIHVSDEMTADAKRLL